MTDNLDDLQQFVGNSETSEDVITASQIGRLAVTLNVDHPAPDKGDAVPPGWHGVFFPGLVPYERLRSDGQPSGGGVAPPVPLPRRRLVGVRGEYLDALRVGDDVTKLTEVAEIRIKNFGAGPTARVTVRETISSSAGSPSLMSAMCCFLAKAAPAILISRSRRRLHPPGNGPMSLTR